MGLSTIIGVIVALVLGVAAGLGGAYYYYQTKLKPVDDQLVANAQAEAERHKREAEADAERLKQAAQAESQQVLNKAQSEVKQMRQEADKAVERRYQDLSRTEERLDKRQINLDNLLAKLEQREQNLNKRQTRIDRRYAEMDKIEEERTAELQRIAAMTQEEAREQLLVGVEQEARQDMARVMREVEERAKEEADDRARKYIALAIQRVGSEYVSEATISVVPLPSDEMKGRIIGRNGRNIRAFEMAAGVDVIVDDTPEAVTISCFDPVRREIARRALGQLVIDGRIHPARIEKLLKDAAEQVERDMRKAGEDAAYEANVHGLHPEIVKMLGRLRYRTSYGQNQLDHSVEASKIAAILAAEIGANVEMSKMGGLLHDLGKAMDHDQEGTHAQLGADFAKRFNVPPIVLNAIASHHHEVDQESVEAILVETADAISGARPGARRESMENYIKRIRTLEDIATSFEGVDAAYALQAGREIRIIVKPGLIDDLGAMRLSRDISKTIEDNMQYPGQIQVTVIRETRAVGFAK
ncbi:MAG: ribonuclease Y [Chloroflexi bacterium]|nr:ribonuclease Y [Chloroflexota bacterium]